LSTIIGKKRNFIAIFLTVFIIILLVILFSNSKNTGSAEALPEKFGYSITESNAASYDVDAIVAAEIEKIVKHVEETERKEKESAAQATVQVESSKTVQRAETNYDPGNGSRWDQLAQCECGGNWGCNTGNGFGGGLQFMHQRSYSTWLSFGGGEFAPNPWDASREQQIIIAERVLASSGWKAWPGCSKKFGWL
jgi:hypothetical protein